jgi:hypothetical protein
MIHIIIWKFLPNGFCAAVCAAELKVREARSATRVYGTLCAQGKTNRIGAD